MFFSHSLSWLLCVIIVKECVFAKVKLVCIGCFAVCSVTCIYIIGVCIKLDIYTRALKCKKKLIVTCKCKQSVLLALIFCILPPVISLNYYLFNK